MNKKILVVIIIVILVSVGGIYLLQQKKNGQNYQPNTNNPQTQSINSLPNDNLSNLDIIIKNFLFSPAELTIKAGDTVVWTNQDSMAHVIAGSGFQSDTLNKGQSFSFTFNNVGTFDYICSIHPSMKGKIIVQ